MAADKPLDGERCPSCGARMQSGNRQCAMCGDRVPLRHSISGMAIESLVVVGVVIIAAVALIWLRQSGRGLVTDDERTAETEVVAQLPSAVPTFTAPPRPTSTRALNTVPPPMTPLPETVVHEVRSGDTLFGIAQQYSVTADEIISVNELERPDALWIGQALTVPLRAADVSGGTEQIALAADADEQSGEADGASAEESADEADTEGDDAIGEDGDADAAGGDEAGSEAPDAGAEPGPTGQPLVIGEPEIHVVGRGESIGVISAKYDVSIDELLELNPDRLSGPNDTLYVGDEVVVRQGAVVTTTPEPAAALPTHAPGQEEVGGTAGEMSAVPFEPAGESEFPAPVPLAPGGGVTVTAESVLLRWSSAGVLPGGLYYVVAIREAVDGLGVSGPDGPDGSGAESSVGAGVSGTAGGEAIGGDDTGSEAGQSGAAGGADSEPEARLIWVTDANAVRIPGELRPALGNSHEIEWSVSVRRRSGGGLLGADESVLLSPEPRWQRFAWAPSPAMDDGQQTAP